MPSVGYKIAVNNWDSDFGFMLYDLLRIEQKRKRRIGLPPVQLPLQSSGRN